MGMFDYVIPECALPDTGAAEVRQWQTKDFDWPFMHKYRITADGRLMHERVHYEDRGDRSAGWDDTNFHGVLNFYGFTDGREWYEYNATFTHGQLEGVARVTRDGCT